MRVEAVDHIVLNVRDVETSAHWYERVLGMRREEKSSKPGGAVRTSLHFGSQKINLRPTSASQEDWFTARQPASGGSDLCFLVDAPPEEVVRWLKDAGVSVEVGPTNKSGALGQIRSVYCRDPDGNLIELATYEGGPR